MESVWSVSKLSTESVGSRRELVANCVHTADADATKQFRCVGVGGVYWSLLMLSFESVSAMFEESQVALEFYRSCVVLLHFGTRSLVELLLDALVLHRQPLVLVHQLNVPSRVLITNLHR